jgi:hypothetical protein
MIMKHAPKHQYDKRSATAGASTSNLKVGYNARCGIIKGTGYSITKVHWITLMPGGIRAGKGRKNKREHQAPQSGIQMLFVVLCSLRNTGTSYAPPFPGAREGL